MEERKDPRNKPTHIQSTNLSQRHQEHKMGKGESLQQVVLEKLNAHLQKNETGPLHHSQKVTQNGLKT